MKEGALMELKGKRVTIKPIQLEDIYLLRDWGTHDNPLLADYNISELTYEELEKWYYSKTRNSRNRYFSIFNEKNRLIGYLGIKSIRKLLKDSLLGIVIDPNYVNLGYGTDAIMTFLDYYFNEMKMKRLYLEVAKFNKRAISCYKKCGFEIVDLYLYEFFDQSIDMDNPYYVEEKSSFVIKNKKIYNYIYKMRIDRLAYLKEKERFDRINGKNKIGTIT